MRGKTNVAELCGSLDWNVIEQNKITASDSNMEREIKRKPSVDLKSACIYF